MKLIVDTNILFSFFWEKSVTRKLLMKQGLELFAPEYALEEINKYRKDICKKAGITEKKFRELRHDLAIAVVFMPIEEYERKLKSAATISPDPKDSDFFALSLHLKHAIWTNDTRLKDQNKIKIVTTKDLLNNPEFVDVVFPLE